MSRRAFGGALRALLPRRARRGLRRARLAIRVGFRRRTAWGFFERRFSGSGLLVHDDYSTGRSSRLRSSPSLRRIPYFRTPPSRAHVCHALEICSLVAWQNQAISRRLSQPRLSCELASRRLRCRRRRRFGPEPITSDRPTLLVHRAGRTWANGSIGVGVGDPLRRKTGPAASIGRDADAPRPRGLCRGS